MEGGFRWEYTKNRGFGKIMSFRPNGLAVSLPAASVLGKAPMALEDELCKGLQRSLVHAPVLLLRPFRSSSGHCLMLLPAASLSHPGRALGLLEAPSGDCLSISLSKGTGTEALMFNVDLEGTVFLYSTPVSHKHCRLRCWFPAPLENPSAGLVEGAL